MDTRCYYLIVAKTETKLLLKSEVFKITNTALLKARIVLKGYTMIEIAKALGISYTAFRQKIYNVRQFKVTEIQLLCEILNIEDKDSYFFANV